METDLIDYDDTEHYASDVRKWIDRILKLYQYLGEHQPSISAENPSYFFQEPGYRRDIEVSSDGSEGVLHSHDRDRSPKTLSAEQLELKMRTLHASLKEKALQRAEKYILRELASKKLEDTGIY